MKGWFELNDTIAAISTPPGEGALGIVRISGKAALEVAGKVFRDGHLRAKDRFESHRVYYGFIVDPANSEKIDEVMLASFLAPRTFTKQDMVEISGHGGPVPLGNILTVILNQGVRLALPGEFTQRAFLNGRIDLTQTEAVIDIIRAKSEAGLKTALRQLEGGLGKDIAALRKELIAICAEIEAGIDFPEEELDFLPLAELEKRVAGILEKINLTLENFEQGRIVREGFNVVIIGRPNVGKSSLLNALLEEERAIVTAVPGTTRDIIREEMVIDGLVMKIIDTAGLRQTEEEVESHGIKRTEKAITQADLILLLLDGSEELTGDDQKVLKEVEGKKVIYVINKNDLERKVDYKDLGIGPVVIEISAKYAQGIGRLKSEISRRAGREAVLINSQSRINRFRHQESLLKVKVNLENTLQAIGNNLSSEFIALDLRAALEALGEITGETFTEEILNRIFSEFCIGK